MHGDSKFSTSSILTDKPKCKVRMHICKTMKIYSFEKMTDMSTGCQALGRGD